MTKEDAINLLRANVMVACDTSAKVGYGTPLNRAIEQALDMAIKALEQEGYYKDLAQSYERTIAKLTEAIAEKQPSEDCVSRQVVIKALNCEISGKIESDIDLSKYKREFQEFANMILNAQAKTIQSLPPVTPTRKQGKWDKGYGFPDGAYWKCSCCNELIKVRYPMNYCPNCGADMRGREE